MAEEHSNNRKNDDHVSDAPTIRSEFLTSVGDSGGAAPQNRFQIEDKLGPGGMGSSRSSLNSPSNTLFCTWERRSRIFFNTRFRLRFSTMS